MSRVSTEVSNRGAVRQLDQALTETERARVQRRTVAVLATATILGGLGVGASLSVGALLLAEVSGNDAISGLGSAMFNAGAAAAGIPLARLAARRGRRRALVVGSLVAMVGACVSILGAQLTNWPVLAVGIGMVGVASAVQLLSRFSATDLALPEKRARDLSLVVWSITVGAVVGPNLLGPGAAIGALLGVTPLAGVFVFPIIAQLLAAGVNFFGLRPDPLLAARAMQARDLAARQDAPSDAPAAAQAEQSSVATSTNTSPGPGGGARAQQSAPSRRPQVLTITAIAAAQAIMVALMAMTPLHLMHHDGTAELVGFTLSLHIAGMYAFSPVFGYLAGRIGRVPTIFLGWVVLLASIVVAYVAGDSHTLVQVSLTLLGVGWSMVTVAGAALLTELTELTERPKWQGRSDAIMSGAGAVAGVLAGFVFALGGFATLAAGSVLLLVLGVVVTFRLRTPRG